MNLRIRQTQIGDSGLLTLGILGTAWLHEAGENGENNRVQLLLRVQNHVYLSIPRIVDAIEEGLKTYGEVSATFQEGESIVLFSVAVVGGLRNPESFLRSVARKVEKVIDKTTSQLLDELDEIEA